MGLLGSLNLKLPAPASGPQPSPTGPTHPVPNTLPKKSGLGGAADAVLAAAMAASVQSADQQMNAALAAANNVGNPLNNRTQGHPDSKARQFWQAGMVRFWQPGSAARMLAQGLQGEARIAKANEAAALLTKAQAVFQEGLRTLG